MSSMDDKERLLQEETDTVDEETFMAAKPDQRRWRCFGRLYFVSLHVLLVVLLVAVVRIGGLSQCPAEVNVVSNSPALQAIEFERKQEHAIDHNKYSIYSGPPNEEQDRAWDKLVRPSFFSATRDELIAANETIEDAAELVEGGYLASLGVWHEVHCLRQLRLFLYQDTYYPNINESQVDYLRGHLDHCIETIRLSVMCHVDTSVYTFAWQYPIKEKPATKSSSWRTCVKWDKLESWSRTRMVPMAPRMKMPPESKQVNA